MNPEIGKAISHKSSEFDMTGLKTLYRSGAEAIIEDDDMDPKTGFQAQHYRRTPRDFKIRIPGALTFSTRLSLKPNVIKHLVSDGKLKLYHRCAPDGHKCPDWVKMARVEVVAAPNAPIAPIQVVV